MVVVTSIRIPCDGSPLQETILPLKTLYPDEYSNNYLETEKRLGRIPETWRCDDRKSFDWLSRSLIAIYADSLGKDSGEWRADYLMYTCLNRQSSTCGLRTYLSILEPLGEA